MTLLLFILSCFIVSFLYWKLKWTLAKLWLILFCLSAIGLLILPFNLEVGILIASICVGLMVLIFFLGLIGMGVATIVAAPFVLLYSIIKSMFIK